jgi:hypothetical protein
MHRWGSTEITLVGVLGHWDDLACAHLDANKSVEWRAMEDIKVVLGEFHSILRPLRHVQTLSQSGSKFNLLDAVLNLSACYRNVCQGNHNTVSMLWPAPPIGSSYEDRPSRTSDQLDPRSRLVLQKLRNALDSRYFFRFHPIKSLGRASDFARLTESNVTLADFKASYLFELAQLFHPELYKGDFIDANCACSNIADSELASLPDSWSLQAIRIHQASLLKAALWKKIRELASIAGRDLLPHRNTVSQSPSSLLLSQDTVLMSQPATPPSRPSRKRMRSTAAQLGLGSPVSSEDGSVTSPALPASVSEMVDTEIQRYKTMGRWWKHDRSERTLESRTAIQWWTLWGEREFPCLTRVALALFGLLPGSGALECDIGTFKDVIPPKRARLEPAAVEMHIVVSRNKDLTELDPGRLVPVPHTSWERLYPSRPLSPVGYEEEDPEPQELLDDHIDLCLTYEFDPN